MHKIDIAFFTDFLVVLLTKKVDKQQKVTLMLKIIQECLASAKTGKTAVIREASQRLFDLTTKTIESESNKQVNQNFDENVLNAQELAIQQKMYITHLERQLLHYVVDLTESVETGAEVKSAVVKLKGSVKDSIRVTPHREQRKMPCSMLVQSRHRKTLERSYNTKDNS